MKKLLASLAICGLFAVGCGPTGTSSATRTSTGSATHATSVDSHGNTAMEKKEATHSAAPTRAAEPTSKSTTVEKKVDPTSKSTTTKVEPTKK